MLSILKSGAKLNKKRDINTNQANFSNIKACKNLSPEPLPCPPPRGGGRKLRKDLLRGLFVAQMAYIIFN